jgi:hypothetical protein
VIAPDVDAGRAAPWKSGHVALFAGAAAFVTAFGLTIALSASGGSRRPQIAEVARAAVLPSAATLRAPALQPSAMPFESPPVPAVPSATPPAVDSTVVPSAKRPLRRKVVRDNDRVAAERRYGI